MRGDSGKTNIFHGEYHNPWPENHDQLSNLLGATWSLDPPRTNGICSQKWVSSWHRGATWSNDPGAEITCLKWCKTGLTGKSFSNRAPRRWFVPWTVRLARGHHIGINPNCWRNQNQVNHIYIYIHRDRSKPMRLPYDWGNQHRLTSYWRVPHVHPAICLKSAQFLLLLDLNSQGCSNPW